MPLNAAERKTDIIDSLVEEFNKVDLINLKDGDHKVQALCDNLHAISLDTSDTSHAIISNTIYGRYYNAIGKYNEAFDYLVKAQELYEDAKLNPDVKLDSAIVCLMWNNIGICYINANLDYKKAQKYFIKAAETAQKNSLNTEYAKIAYNMTLLNFTRNDGSVLEFAQEIYDQGSKWNDDYIKLMGEISLAINHYVKADYNQALRYIESATTSSELHPYKVVVYTTYGNILSAIGKSKEAEEAFKITQEHLDEELLTTAAYSLLSYGRFLVEQNRPRKAIPLLNKAINYNNNQNYYNVFLYQIHLTLASAYSATGDWKSALKAYKDYHAEYSQVFDVMSERAINALSLQYQTVSHKVKIQEYDLEVANKNRAILILTFIFTIALIFGVFAWVMYRNNNRLYTKIAKQYKIALEKEQELRERISLQKAKIAELSKEDTSTPPVLPATKLSLSEDLNKELFIRLEQVMKEDKIFKDHNLTLESLAKKLATNRTYLTVVINANTDKSFVQYVNYYRVEESLRLLSDIESDYPLKVVCDESGFSSRTTFYKFFKEQVGMEFLTLPAEKVKQLH